MKSECLFCNSTGPFSVEHIIPESLGNDVLILEREVCAKCNNHFAKVEEFVLQKTSIAFWRVFLGIRSKKGRLPSVDLSQPDREKGKFTKRHAAHTDLVGFTAHEDESTSVDVDDPDIITSFLQSNSGRFEFAITPNVLFMLGRFLCMVGIEMVCHSDRTLARAEKYKLARNFARFGNTDDLWPIFHFSEGSPSELRSIQWEENEAVEHVECFEYSLIELEEKYMLFRLKVGTDNWIVCLNDKWPTPEVRAAFPGKPLQLVWYSPDEIR